ncbi:ABC transporter ATP-binding protein [Streptomyces sp. NPDC046909]|uniref:ABC transporter ATP-binding protein n=1 Tax=Streptomyces sp. NPDC046909 TaxID=3155617 RepID=UPI0033F1B54B
MKTTAEELDTLQATTVGAPAALEAEDLTVRFGGVRAVNAVSLRVAPGELLGLIGPNGAGKTTLFDAVSGLNRPSAGRVLLGGRDVTGETALNRSRLGLRRTFQRQQVFGRLSVLDNLLAALEWHGGGGGLMADVLGLPSRRRLERVRRARAEETLHEVGLWEQRDTYAGHLPVGLARLMELARAVVDEPSVLLLDEPTSGLDEAESSRLIGIVHRLMESRSTAVLLVEHDVRFVMDNCGRIVVLNLGEVLMEGNPAEVAADESVREAYLRG